MIVSEQESLIRVKRYQFR